ncbi:MAG: EAL domain-containing protein [Lachnospiraceae bacterium]
MEQLLNVKVNLSSLDLMRTDCSSHFIRIMDKYEIPHEWIQFEITETVATEYNASLRMVVDEFTAAGIRLCLDDFGSGYANLNTVMKLPFSTIKLDRSLLLISARMRKGHCSIKVLWRPFRK